MDWYPRSPEGHALDSIFNMSCSANASWSSTPTKSEEQTFYQREYIHPAKYFDRLSHSRLSYSRMVDLEQRFLSSDWIACVWWSFGFGSSFCFNCLLERALNPFDGKIDGYLARRFNMRSILGTILDPAADKILMTTLVVTLTMKGLLPRTSILSSLLKLIITDDQCSSSGSHRPGT
jgi:hypothetical protein